MLRSATIVEPNAEKRGGHALRRIQAMEVIMYQRVLMVANGRTDATAATAMRNANKLPTAQENVKNTLLEKTTNGMVPTATSIVCPL